MWSILTTPNFLSLGEVVVEVGLSAKVLMHPSARQAYGVMARETMVALLVMAGVRQEEIPILVKVVQV